MVINEQFYCNLNRPYYRGIPYNRIDYSKSRYNCVYLTNSFAYAVMYSYKGNNEHGYVYEYHLAENMNIFNAKSKRDVLKLKSEVKKQLRESPEFSATFKDFDFNDSFFEQLSKYDWASIFKDDKRRDIFAEAAKAANFDGFFNFEWNRKSVKDNGIEFGFESVLDQSPAVGIFNIEKMKVVRRFSFDEFFSFNDFVKAHNEDLDKLKQYVYNLYNNGVDEYEDLAYDYAAQSLLFLDIDEVADIVSGPEDLDESFKNTKSAKLFRECMDYGESQSTYNGFKCRLNENYNLIWSRA